MYYALCLRIYTYSYVFTISRENPTKSHDFGTHEQLSSRRVTLSIGSKSADHQNDVDLRKTKKSRFFEYLPEFSVKSRVSGTHV